MDVATSVSVVGMWRSELPAQLDHAFTVAEARAAGVPSGRLQAAYLRAPFHGARTLAALDELRWLRLLMATVPAHAFACGPTAAALHRMPLPIAMELTALSAPTIGVPLPNCRIRRPEVKGRALRVAEADLTIANGVRCTTLARTWVDLAAALDLPRLVAVTDHLIARRGGRIGLETLQAAHARAGNGRGARARAQALVLCSDGAESPRESEVRALFAVAGLPLPQTNVEIWSRGEFIARVDVLYPEKRVVVEYDGEYHQTDAQWRRDQSRRARLRELGYHLVIVTSTDLQDPASLIARVRRLVAA